MLGMVWPSQPPSGFTTVLLCAWLSVLSTSTIAHSPASIPPEFTIKPHPVVYQLHYSGKFILPVYYCYSIPKPTTNFKPRRIKNSIISVIKLLVNAYIDLKDDDGP